MVTPVEQTFAKPVKNETDEEIRARLVDTFDTMNKISEATIKGENTAFIIAGPAGLGKSHGVMQIAEKYELKGRKCLHIKGFVRATGLYKLLYEHREAGQFLIFDDADSIFNNEDSLNILKSACDLSAKRHITWGAETNMEDESGEKLPTRFEYKGSIIFISNMDFDALIEKGFKQAEHLKAMISRSLYLDIDVKTIRDYMMLIRMRVEEGMLKPLKLTEFDEAELMMFVENNAEKMRELSLRIVLKIASLMRIDRNGWKKLAQKTCFKVAHR